MQSKKNLLKKKLKRSRTRNNKNIKRGGLGDILIKIISLVDDEQSYNTQLFKTDKVSVLKQNIYDWLGINLENQIITFQDRVLEEDQTLMECGLQNNSTVYVEDISLRINFTVATVDGQASYQEKDLSAMHKVMHLKKNILEWFDINIENQIITFQGRVLDDEQTLTGCGIQYNSTVYVEDISLRLNFTVATVDGQASYQEKELSLMFKVKALKQNILEWLDIKIENQVITFEGRVIDSEQTLNECGIRNNSIVYVEDYKDRDQV
jgi:hypothetical protein